MTATTDGHPSIAGYDRLDLSGLVAAFRQSSQAELMSIESYERRHKARPTVLEKLRYLRGPEPLEGYDGLNVSEVLAAVDGADLRTLSRVRTYEGKMRAREEVLGPVESLRHRRQPEKAAGDLDSDRNPSPFERNGWKDKAGTVGVWGLMLVLGALLLLAASVLFLVVMSAVAPNALG